MTHFRKGRDAGALAEHRIVTPLADEAAALFGAGDKVLITGSPLAAGDDAHRRLSELIRAGRPLPVSLKGEIICDIDPPGPASSCRTDAYAHALPGFKAAIGKGQRGPEVRKAMLEEGAVYLAAGGGAGALLSEHMESAKIERRFRRTEVTP